MELLEDLFPEKSLKNLSGKLLFKCFVVFNLDYYEMKDGSKMEFRYNIMQNPDIWKEENTRLIFIPIKFIADKKSIITSFELKIRFDSLIKCVDYDFSAFILRTISNYNSKEKSIEFEKRISLKEKRILLYGYVLKELENIDRECINIEVISGNISENELDDQFYDTGGSVFNISGWNSNPIFPSLYRECLDNLSIFIDYN